MAETYEEETRRILENRKRNAEIRREQQIKRRNSMLIGIGGILVVILLIIVICISCSSGKNTKKKEQVTTKPQSTTVVETTTVAETTTRASMYTTDVLNLRKQPNTESDIITKISAGKRVEIISEEGKWCKVQRGKDIGYVMKKYLSYENILY